MKTLGGVLLVAACLVACTHSFPGARDDDDEKNLATVLVLPSDSSDEVMGTSWYNMMRPSFFDRWQTRLEAFMRNIRNQMTDILSNIPERGIVSSGKIPEGANSTSTTKVINGHVVTINETTYTDGDDEYSTLIRVRVIDVRPQNDTILMTESEENADATTTIPTVSTSRTAAAAAASAGTATTNKEDRTTPSRSIETVEELDNELPDNQVEVLTA